MNGYSDKEREHFFGMMIQEIEQMGAGAANKAARNKRPDFHGESPEAKALAALHLVEGRFHFKIQINDEQRATLRRKYMNEYERVFDFAVNQKELF